MSDTEAIRRAALGIAHAMIFADGKVPDREVSWLFRMAREDPLFVAASDSDLTIALSAAREEAELGNLPRAVECWARQIPPHLAASVFRLAIRAAFADGKVAAAEGDVAIHLRHALELSDVEAAAIYREVRANPNRL